MDDWWETLAEVTSQPVGVSSQFLRSAPPEVETVSSQNSPRTCVRARACRGEESEETPFTSGSPLRKNSEETQAPSEQTLPRETLSPHLSLLLSAIERGCCEGYASRLDGVNPTRSQRLLAAAATLMPAGELEGICRQAGPVTTLATLVTLYRRLCSELSTAGDDPFLALAALELALVPRTAQATS